MLNLNLQWVLFHRSNQHSLRMRRCRCHEADNLLQTFSRSRSIGFRPVAEQTAGSSLSFHVSVLSYSAPVEVDGSVARIALAKYAGIDPDDRSCTYGTAETAKARGTRGRHIKLWVGLWIELITTAAPAHCLPRNLALRQCLQAWQDRRVLMSFRKR